MATNFALIEIFGALNTGFGLLELNPSDTTVGLALNLLWLFGCATAVNFAGGYVAGYLLPRRSRRAAVGAGILSTALTLLVIFMISWGSTIYVPVPGLSFAANPDNVIPQLMLFWATLLPPNNLLAATYGAMLGNQRGTKVMTQVEQLRDEHLVDSQRRATQLGVGRRHAA